MDHGNTGTEGRPYDLINEHAAESIIELAGPCEALKSYIETHNVRHDVLDDKLITSGTV